MPFFQQSTQLRQMLQPTPDHYATYQENTSDVYQQSTYIPTTQRVTANRKDLAGADGPEYMNLYAQRPNNLFHPYVYGKDNSHQQSSTYVSLPANPVTAYAPANAPLLPPIHVPDRSRDGHQHPRSKRTQPAPQPKEEKPVGGVSAYLDYEMEQMADFVSEMAQGMYDLYESRICLADIDIIRSVNPNALVPPAFRKYVLQVLSSTRLPRTTILLGLLYLSSRMTMLSASGRYTTGSGQVYRMLVTSLLLGSKFLDDNTFQNRSWSEVSNIPVVELNLLELEWLMAINWDMHIDSDDPQGFILWEKHWDNWQVKMTLETSMESLKLNPLGPSITQQQLVNKSYSHSAPYPSPSYQDATRASPYVSSYKDATLDSALKEHLRQQWQTPQSTSHDHWPSMQARTDYSPPSAPETGPATPDFYSHIGAFGYGANLPNYDTGMSSQNMTPTGHQTSYLTQYTPYVPNGWNNHGIHCGCAYCRPHHDHYFMAPGFGPQPVAG